MPCWMWINSDNIHVYYPFQEKIAKQKANEAKLKDEKENLRQRLDDAENRVTKGELSRRQLEGELQRFKLVMNDKETQNQVCTQCIIFIVPVCIYQVCI